MVILPWLCGLTWLALGLAAGCFKPLPLPMTSYDAAVLAAAASESWRRKTREKRLRLLNLLYVAACYASEPSSRPVLEDLSRADLWPAVGCFPVFTPLAAPTDTGASVVLASKRISENVEISFPKIYNQDL